MYCQKCGRRLDKSTEKCPECGTIIADSYCGGFWDLLGSSPDYPKQNTDTSGENISKEVGAVAAQAIPEANIEKTEKKYKRRIKAVSVLLLIALLALGIQTIRVGSLINKVNDLETKNKQLEEEYTSLKNEYEEKEKEWAESLANSIVRNTIGPNVGNSGNDNNSDASGSSDYDNNDY